MAEQLVNSVQSVLDEATGLNQTATTLNVADGSVFPSSGDFRIAVDNELMKVTARSTNALTVVRGQEGTTATTHENGAQVLLVWSAAMLGALGLPVTGGGIPGKHGWILEKSALYGMSHNVEYLVEYDEEVLDTDGYHGGAPYLSKVTIPTGKAGLYVVSSFVHFQPFSGLNYYHHIWTSSETYICSAIIPNGQTTVDVVSNLSTIVQLAEGDYLDVRLYIDGGGGTVNMLRSAGLYPRFAGVLLAQ